MSEEQEVVEEQPKKARRGFAAMSPEKQRAIASKGGRTVQDLGKGHRFTTETARAAGQKGGRASSGKARSRRKEG